MAINIPKEYIEKLDKQKSLAIACREIVESGTDASVINSYLHFREEMHKLTLINYSVAMSYTLDFSSPYSGELLPERIKTLRPQIDSIKAEFNTWEKNELKFSETREYASTYQNLTSEEMRSNIPITIPQKWPKDNNLLKVGIIGTNKRYTDMFITKFKEAATASGNQVDVSCAEGSDTLIFVLAEPVVNLFSLIELKNLASCRCVYLYKDEGIIRQEIVDSFCAGLTKSKINIKNQELYNANQAVDILLKKKSSAELLAEVRSLNPELASDEYILSLLPRASRTGDNAKDILTFLRGQYNRNSVTIPTYEE